MAPTDQREPEKGHAMAQSANLNHPRHLRWPDLGVTGQRLLLLLHQEAQSDLVQGLSQKQLADACMTSPTVLSAYIRVLQHLDLVVTMPPRKGSPGGQPNTYWLACCHRCEPAQEKPQLRVVQ